MFEVKGAADRTGLKVIRKRFFTRTVKKILVGFFTSCFLSVYHFSIPGLSVNNVTVNVIPGGKMFVFKGVVL